MPLLDWLDGAGLRARTIDTIMRSPERAAALANAVLELAAELR